MVSSGLPHTAFTGCCPLLILDRAWVKTPRLPVPYGACGAARRQRVRNPANPDYSPMVYYGLKHPAYKGCFTILILDIAQLCLRVKTAPTSLSIQGVLRLVTTTDE